MRTQIQEYAHQRTLEIEEQFAHRHVPPTVVAIYQLYRAIVLGNPNAYVQEIGAMPLAAVDACAGKQEMSWGD